MGHAHEALAVGGQKVDVLSVLRHRVVRPPASRVERVGEVERAVRPDPDIVRTVQRPALVPVEKHGDLAVRGDGPEGGLLVGAGDQIAAGVETHAVGAACRLQERDQRAAHGPLQDAVVRLIGEEEVALRVTRRPLGEREAAGEFLQRGAWRDDAVLAFSRHDLVTHPAPEPARRRAAVFRRTSGTAAGANCCMSLAMTPVHPVWWLAPRPAPLSPWKYS